MLAPILLLCGLTIAFSLPLKEDYGRQQCGYESCPLLDDNNVLNVHIVAHTHDDVGWLKTVDQYYYGSRNNIQKAGVQYILDSVIKELWVDPKRKFIYVETAFFWKWWVRQSQEVQQKVHKLVREGRLQFVGGAWSMNDEAASHYHSTVDQFTWGLSKINQTFGPCALPRVGWQIDPFGHSREFASLLAGMGYDGLFLGRIDYQDKTNRLMTRSMEMVWRGDDDLGISSDIFTGVLYNTYSPPPGFCFDILCDDEPIIDDPNSPMFNVDNKIDVFIDYVKTQATKYMTNNVIVTMGGDFTYQHAEMWYNSLDKLIKYTNLKAAKDGLNIKVFYSTPNCYLKAVKDANPTLPTKHDDFFPYASDSHSYWTGYFTSRPTTKYFERQGNGYLQMAKQLQVLTALEKHNEVLINELKSAMGIWQHHDAITGTEKQHVTHDYVRILDQAVEDSLIVPRLAFNKMMTGNATAPPLLNFNRCRLNESVCHTSEDNDQFVVTLYNPVAWHRNVSVRIPVTDAHYAVYAPMGSTIESQLVDIPKAILELPTRKSNATHELVFIAYLKPLFYKSYYVTKVKKIKRSANMKLKRHRESYESINNYWKEIKEKTDVEIKSLEDATEATETVQKPKNTIINGKIADEEIKNVQEAKKATERVEIPTEKTIYVKIPVEPTVFKDADVKSINLDILKDKNEEFNNKIDELDKIIADEKAKAVKTSRPATKAYPHLSDDEMRMLSDDPGVVEMGDDYFVMEKENMSLRIDRVTGRIKTATFPSGHTINFTYNFYYYPGAVGNNEIPQNRSSGAYILRPDSVQPVALKNEDFKLIRGNVVNEFRTAWSDNVFSVVRQYDGIAYLEVDWIVGPIDVTDNTGKEYIIKYETNIVNNGEFYTDSNGRQILMRKLDYRPQYNVTLAEPVAGNYYPVTNEIYIEDRDYRMTVLTDRSQGGTSLIEGEIELMLHRRLLHDDAFGVGEALDETIDEKGLVVRGTHRIFVSDKVSVRKQAIEADLQPITFVSPTKLSVDDWLSLTNCFSWLKAPLPEGIHLLTLEPWGDKILLRLENYLTAAEDAKIEVDLTNILQNIKVKAFKETVLSANEWVEARDPWVWNKVKEAIVKREIDDDDDNEVNQGGEISDDVEGEVNERGDFSEKSVDKMDDHFRVVIKAKQIRTFVIDYEYYP